MSVVAVGAAVGAVAGVASAVSAGNQGKKALVAAANQASIEARNNFELQEALQKAQTQEARLKIMADSVSNIKSAQTTAIIASKNAAKQAQKQANDRNLLIVTLGGGVILMTAVIVLKRS
jgi:3-dehydroquinate synthetase